MKYCVLFFMFSACAKLKAPPAEYKVIDESKKIRVEI